MKQISKLDFYAGAFISSILGSATGAPALFDETSDSKRFQIATDLGDFNIYIKYTGVSRTVSKGKRKRKKTSWYVSFTKADIVKLEDEFVCKGYKNYIVLVLSNDKLTDTKIAVIDYEDAMNCLENVTPSGGRGINVVRYGSEHNFKCYGATQKENDVFLVPVNFMKYFDKDSSEEEHYHETN